MYVCNKAIMGDTSQDIGTFGSIGTHLLYSLLCMYVLYHFIDKRQLDFWASVESKFFLLEWVLDDIILDSLDKKWCCIVNGTFDWFCNNSQNNALQNFSHS